MSSLIKKKKIETNADNLANILEQNDSDCAFEIPT